MKHFYVSQLKWSGVGGSAADVWGVHFRDGDEGPVSVLSEHPTFEAAEASMKAAVAGVPGVAPDKGWPRDG